MGVQGVSGVGAHVPTPATTARTPRLEETSQAAQGNTTAGATPSGDQGSTASSVQSGTTLASERTGTNIRIDQDTNRIVAQVLGEDGEVIAEIPPEAVLKAAEKLRELEGLLFNQEA
jgi:uncharacterized FlaG/YvyC family protein